MPIEIRTYDKAAHEIPPRQPPENPFNRFLLNGKSGEMKEKMLADKHILGEVAILGQATVFYAKPNTGKTLLTLYMLVEKISQNEIDGKDIIYINADDTHKGLVTKLEIAEHYKFGMVAPGYENFRADDFVKSITNLARADQAHGVVIILDTLKKFTDIMDKRKASDFGKIIRYFVSKGGSVIMLAHTNKHRDADGKLVFSGTSDIVDDVDCAYILDAADDGQKTAVIFENIKSRGDVIKTVGYSYSSKPRQSYWDILNSVKVIDDQEREEAKQQQRIDSMLEKNKDVIAAVIEIVMSGITKKTDVVIGTRKLCGCSNKIANNVINSHCGSSYSKGHRWFEKKGNGAIKEIELLSQTYNTIYNE